MSFNLYYNNVDFPGNNIMMWRPRAEGGRWRWVVKDVDYTMGLYGDPYNYKIIEWLYNPGYDWNKHWGANSSEATRLFRRLMEDADFNRAFIDRTCIYMGDFMNEKGTWEIWEPMYQTIRKEYPHHRKLINQWWPNYSEEMQNARNWLAKRTNEFYSQIGAYYKLGTPIPLQVNPQFTDQTTGATPSEASAAEDQHGVTFTFNDVPLSKGTFDGKFFANRNITLRGTPHLADQTTGTSPSGAWGAESIVTGWDITRVTASGTTFDHIDGDVCSLTMPNCQRLIVRAVIGQNTGIADMKTRTWQWTADATQLRLTHLEAGTDVRLYDLQGRLLHHVKAQSPTLTLPLPAPSSLFILKVGSEAMKIRR